MRDANPIPTLLAIACLVLCACTQDGETMDADTPNPTPETLADRDCPDDSFVTYEDFGGPFMYSWCNGCHAQGLPADMRQDAPLGVDFDTLYEVRAWADRIWARAGDHNVTMPPIGGPDEVDRELIGEWLACGAPALGDMWAGE